MNASIEALCRSRYACVDLFVHEIRQRPGSSPIEAIAICRLAFSSMARHYGFKVFIYERGCMVAPGRKPPFRWNMCIVYVHIFRRKSSRRVFKWCSLVLYANNSHNRLLHVKTTAKPPRKMKDHAMRRFASLGCILWSTVGVGVHPPWGSLVCR